MLFLRTGSYCSLCVCVWLPVFTLSQICSANSKLSLLTLCDIKHHTSSALEWGRACRTHTHTHPRTHTHLRIILVLNWFPSFQAVVSFKVNLQRENPSQSVFTQLHILVKGVCVFVCVCPCCRLWSSHTAAVKGHVLSKLTYYEPVFLQHSESNSMLMFLRSSHWWSVRFTQWLQKLSDCAKGKSWFIIATWVLFCSEQEAEAFINVTAASDRR